MKMITAIEAVNMMEEYKGHEFVHVRTQTEPDFKGYKRDKSVLPAFQAATGCDHPTDVVKFSEYNAQQGLEYRKLIERRLIAEGKDTSEYQMGESWHLPYNGSKNLRVHKTTGELYFYLFLTAKGKTFVRYVDTKRGVEIDTAVIKPFLTAPSVPKNQGLDDEHTVNVRTLKLASLLSIKMDGEEYIVR